MAMENSLLEYLFTVHVITLSVLEYTSYRTFLSQNAKELSLNVDKICVTYCLTAVSVLDATLTVAIKHRPHMWKHNQHINPSVWGHLKP
jgi:hypothetical protein